MEQHSQIWNEIVMIVIQSHIIRPTWDDMEFICTSDEQTREENNEGWNEEGFTSLNTSPTEMNGMSIMDINLHV